MQPPKHENGTSVEAKKRPAPAASVSAASGASKMVQKSISNWYKPVPSAKSLATSSTPQLVASSGHPSSAVATDEEPTVSDQVSMGQIFDRQWASKLVTACVLGPWIDKCRGFPPHLVRELYVELCNIVFRKTICSGGSAACTLPVPSKWICEFSFLQQPRSLSCMLLLLSTPCSSPNP